MNIGTIRFQGTVAEYLRDFFCDEATLAELSGIDTAQLRALISGSLAPKAAYIVEGATIASHVFGRMDAQDAPPGHWFSPANVAWVQRALAMRAEHGERRVAAALKARFESGYRDAMRAIHGAEGPLPGLSDADGGFDEVGCAAQFDGVWTHFLAGTFSLCVRDAIDESRIAEKEALQMRLAFATANGAKTRYARAEKDALRALIERYIDVSMPFSPVEYDRSSRRRLVENTLPHLQRD